MTIYQSKAGPHHVINRFTWYVMKNNLKNIKGAKMSETDYAGLMPIVPYGDAPILDEYIELPTIVYSYSESPSLPDESKIGFLTYTISSSHAGVLDDTLRLLMDTYCSEETAGYINKFSSHNKWQSNKNDFNTNAYKGIRITSTDVPLTSPPEPTDTEGGQLSAELTIEYQFVMDRPFNTYDPSWLA